MNLKIRIIIVSAFILTAFFAANTAFGETAPILQGNARGELSRQDQAFFTSSGLRPVSIGTIVAAVIQMVLAFLGIIFLVLIIYAGFNWMTAAGNDEKIKKAKDTMIAAVIGLAIVLAAYAITVFVLNKLLGATGVGSGDEINTQATGQQ